MFVCTIILINMGKINGKLNLLFYCLIVLLFVLLVYSRFIGLGWGLPYPMHPDERNMANAVQQLQCDPSTSLRTSFQNCFNPHFFAYGQVPLYLGYIIVYILKFFDGDLKFPIGYEEAAISLRIISAVASIINFIIIIKIIKFITKKESFFLTLISGLIIIFSPYAIQFAHFGTTESLLMLFYSLIIYLSLQILERRTTESVVWLSLVSGLAVATKISATIFLIIPAIVLMSNVKDQRINFISKLKTLFFIIVFLLCTLIFAIVFSPHNLINFQDFSSSINYESEVALGKSLVFYTRQFFNTQPFIFQFQKIFPYALGFPAFLMGLIGLIGANWKDKKINLLRFAFLVYFIPSATIFAKWSRFMAPIFPIITVFAILLISKIKDQISKISEKLKVLRFGLGFALCALIFTMTIPGIAYLSVYQNPDVHFQASDWIYKNIPNDSNILFETANVVDIPITDQRSKIKDQKSIEKFYQTVSFNFYDLDISPELQLDLKNEIEKADYIFIPSRRIFANHPKQTYPVLNKYYEDLFSGKLGFEKVAEFESFPKIFQWKFPDEGAEETWTVFDHPVIRIYKKVKS